MKFISSPTFLWLAIVSTIMVVIVVVLRKNIIWEPRGITPKELLDRLRSRILPGSIPTWCVIVGAIILIVLGAWGLLGTFSTPSLKSPSLKTVGEVTQSYWLWLLLAGCVAYVLLSFISKERGDLAKKFQTILAVFGVLLFVALVWSWLAKPNSHSGAHSEIPLASEPVSAWPKLVIPAGVGKVSGDIPLPLGMHHIVMVGNNYFLHNVYRGGHECAFGESCPDGAVTKYYATNEIDVENPVSYAFVPIGR